MEQLYSVGIWLAYESTAKLDCSSIDGNSLGQDGNTPQISSHLQRTNNIRPNDLSIAVDKYINTLHHIQENLKIKREKGNSFSGSSKKE